jgi:predicted nucleic acid-binding protein
MAQRLFLDTNRYIDLIKRDVEIGESLRHHLVFISPLSTHILCYHYKIKIPDLKIISSQNMFGVVSLSKFILDKSLQGPTSDLEDNIQLHSAAEAECDYFLTSDEKILRMKFFGKTKIVPNLS